MFLEPTHLVAPINAVFGKAVWGREEPTHLTSIRTSQIFKDLKELDMALPESPKLPRTPTASAADMQLSANMTRTQLHHVTSYTSTADRIWAFKFGLHNESKFACSCVSRLESKARLVTHQWSSYGQTNPIRQLVTTNKCPLCGDMFKDIKHAKNHAQIFCAPKRKHA